jgi:ureidoglycolate lyase
LTTLRAFIVPGSTGVTYRTGTWHHPMVALDRPASFAVLMWSGDELDEELVDFDKAVAVSA